MFARRCWRRVLMAAVFVAGSVVMGSSPLVPTVAAAGVDVQCTGGWTANLSPALSQTTQPVLVTYTSSYAPCTLGPAGTGAFTKTINASCQNLLTTFTPFTETITWIGTDDPKTSSLLYTNEGVTDAVVTFTGVVQSGRFAGDASADQLAITSSAPSTLAQCAAGSGTVSTVSGTLALTLSRAN